MTTATTIEKKYVTNAILKNWLTISIKLNMNNKPIQSKFDLKKLGIVIEEV